MRDDPDVDADDRVWIVQHGESPDNTILGVFASQGEAAVFAAEIADQFANGVTYSSFDVGYRFDQGSRRYRAERQATQPAPQPVAVPDRVLAE